MFFIARAVPAMLMGSIVSNNTTLIASSRVDIGKKHHMLVAGAFEPELLALAEKLSLPACEVFCVFCIKEPAPDATHVLHPGPVVVLFT
jgi:hypothetical protein